MGDAISHAVLTWRSYFPLSWASTSFIGAIVFGLLASINDYLYQEQLHYQERHGNWDYLF